MGCHFAGNAIPNYMWEQDQKMMLANKAAEKDFFPGKPIMTVKFHSVVVYSMTTTGFCLEC